MTVRLTDLSRGLRNAVHQPDNVIRQRTAAGALPAARDYQATYTISLSPDPVTLGSPGEQGVVTALVEESSVAVEGEAVTFMETADPGSATELFPMGELDINGDAVVTIHGLQAGTGTLECNGSGWKR